MAERIEDIAREMVAKGKGILAADESIRTMSARLEHEGIPSSDLARRDYRELLLTAEGLSEWVSGIILADETFGQDLSDGRAFPRASRELGILPGIKVDTGTSPLPGRGGALVTEGLDGLGARLASYAERGAAFAKWRAVFDVHTITTYAARVNGHALARYAALSQEHGIVPIVEPEVLCNGDHDLSSSAQASRLALSALFEELDAAEVDLSGIVLKPSFVTPGLDATPATGVCAGTRPVRWKGSRTRYFFSWLFQPTMSCGCRPEGVRRIAMVGQRAMRLRSTTSWTRAPKPFH